MSEEPVSTHDRLWHYFLFVFQLLAVFGGGDAEVLADVLAEEGEVAETQFHGNLLDGEVGMEQVVAYVVLHIRILFIFLNHGMKIEIIR